jgi:hypothetical protein
MLLDSSHMQDDSEDAETRNERILCAKEYSPEIYKYLREAEVCALCILHLAYFTLLIIPDEKSSSSGLHAQAAWYHPWHA